MSFLETHLSTYINDYINIFDKWDINNINYLIQVNGYEKELLEKTQTRARYWYIPEEIYTHTKLHNNTLDINFFKHKQLNIKFYNFFKNNFHMYCDKHILFSYGLKDYELSLKAIGFNTTNHDIINKLMKETEYPITNSITRYYVKLPINFEINCIEYVKPVIDKTGTVAAEPPKIKIIDDATGISSFIEPPKIIIDVDLILTITLFINKYYCIYKDTPEYDKIKFILEFINKNILLLNLELHNLSKVKQSNNFLIIERDVGSALNNTLIDAYKTKKYSNIPSASYNILYHVPENFMPRILQNQNFFTIFNEMIKLVSDKHKSILEDITKYTTDTEIFNKIELFKAIINSDKTICELYEQIFPLQEIYKFTKNYYQYNSLTEELKTEIDELIQQENYSAVFASTNLGRRYRIFHMHLIKNFNVFRTHIKRYVIDFMHNRVSYYKIRDGIIIKNNN